MFSIDSNLLAPFLIIFLNKCIMTVVCKYYVLHKPQSKSQCVELPLLASGGSAGEEVEVISRPLSPPQPPAGPAVLPRPCQGMGTTDR